MNKIQFDRAKYKLLKTEYSKAVKDGRESFIFEGSEILTSYAEYLIEYLKTQFE